MTTEVHATCVELILHRNFNSLILYFLLAQLRHRGRWYQGRSTRTSQLLRTDRSERRWIP